MEPVRGRVDFDELSVLPSHVPLRRRPRLRNQVVAGVPAELRQPARAVLHFGGIEAAEELKCSPQSVERKTSSTPRAPGPRAIEMGESSLYHGGKPRLRATHERDLAASHAASGCVHSFAISTSSPMSNGLASNRQIRCRNSQLMRAGEAVVTTTRRRYPGCVCSR